jgi:hypothetical protein
MVPVGGLPDPGSYLSEVMARRAVTVQDGDRPMDDAKDVAIMTVSGHEWVDANWNSSPSGLAADVQAASDVLKRFPRAAVVLIDIQKGTKYEDARVSSCLDHIGELFRERGIFVITADALLPKLERGFQGYYWTSSEENKAVLGDFVIKWVDLVMAALAPRLWVEQNEDALRAISVDDFPPRLGGSAPRRPGALALTDDSLLAEQAVQMTGPIGTGSDEEEEGELLEAVVLVPVIMLGQVVVPLALALGRRVP